LSDENAKEHLTLKQKFDRAVSVGTSPEVLKLLFPGWADEQQGLDAENTVRENLFGPEEHQEPSTNPLESYVRYKMKHPLSTEPEAPPGETSEESMRRKLHAPKVE